MTSEAPSDRELIIAAARGLVQRVSRAQVVWVPFAVVAVTHLFLLAADSPPARVTHTLLVPALLLPAWGVRGNLRWFAMAVLCLSWAGDVVPNVLAPEHRLLGTAGFFILVMVTWLIALGDRWSQTWPARRPATAVMYAVAAIAIVALTVPWAGSLAPAVVLYAAAVTGAAIAMTSLGDRGTWSGICFMLQGALLGSHHFVPLLSERVADVTIMAVYALAQALAFSALRHA